MVRIICSLPFLAIAFLGFFTFLLNGFKIDTIIITLMFFSIGAPLLYFGNRGRKRWKGVINSVIYMSREQGKVDIAAIAEKLDMPEVDVVGLINKAQAKGLIPSGAQAAQNESYKVIFTGEIVTGYEIDTVKKNLVNLFQVNIERIEGLFTGHSMLIRDKLDHERAMQYEQSLKKAGAICRVEREQVPAPSAHLTKSVKPVRRKSGEGRRPIKRLAFGIVWFVILYVAAYFVVIFILAVDIAFSGVDPASAEAAGREMGRMLVKQYNGLFVVGTLLLTICGTVLGILPGTKKKAA